LLAEKFIFYWNPGSLGNDPAHLVQYEMMENKKKGQIKSLVKMPGEEWDEPVLDYCHPASEDPK